VCLFPDYWLAILDYDMGPERCPFCGQQIVAGAEKCFFCGKTLSKEAVEKRLEELEIQDQKESFRWRHHHSALLLIVIFVLVFVALCPHPTADRSSPKIIIIPKGTTPNPPLKAEVSYTGTQFTISNNDSFDWNDVFLQLSAEGNGTIFILNVPSIPAGQTYLAEANTFVNTNGISFDPIKTKPQKFSIGFNVQAIQNGSYSYSQDLK
jgi:hypothetical protein